MRRLAPLLRRFGRCQGAATALEYGLLIALLGAVVASAVTATGVRLYGVVNNTSAVIAR